VAGHIRLVNLVLHHHHTGEDEVLWPLLLARAPRDIEPVVHLMEGHHRGIESILAEIDALLGTWTGSAAREDGEALAEALEQLAVGLFEHMGLEEKLVLPLAERHIFAAEWEKMVAEGAADIPPDVGPVLAGMLMYEGGVDVVPPQLRAVLAELAPQAYAAHCERVHGIPAPPRSTEVGIGTPYVGVTADADLAPVAGNRASASLSVPERPPVGPLKATAPPEFLSKASGIRCGLREGSAGVFPDGRRITRPPSLWVKCGAGPGNPPVNPYKPPYITRDFRAESSLWVKNGAMGTFRIKVFSGRVVAG
jgi:hypothetical protein